MKTESISTDSGAGNHGFRAGSASGRARRRRRQLQDRRQTVERVPSLPVGWQAPGRDFFHRESMNVGLTIG